MTGMLRHVFLNFSSCQYFIKPVIRRSMLTTSYGQHESVKRLIKHEVFDAGGDTFTSICLFMDRCMEKGLPFSSVAVNRMVNSIEDREDIKSSIYYLHKFRHSYLSYFLRPWTTFIWLGKCIEFGALDLALTVLEDRSQYGIFPDVMIFLFMIDECLKMKNHDLAMKFVMHMFVAEKLDWKLSQLCCLLTIIKVIKCDSLKESPFSSVTERWNYCAMCYRLGHLLQNESLKIFGLVELGVIEKDNDFRSGFQEQWYPFLSSGSYLKEAMNAIDQCTSLHQEVIDHIYKRLGGDNCLENILSKKVSALTSCGYIVSTPLAETLMNVFELEFPAAEKCALIKFENTVKLWTTTCYELAGKEISVNTKRSLQRERYINERKLILLSKEMAIEKLGYWEFMVENFVLPTECSEHLRDDNVHGSSYDLEIEL